MIKVNLCIMKDLDLGKLTDYMERHNKKYPENKLNTIEEAAQLMFADGLRHRKENNPDLYEQEPNGYQMPTMVIYKNPSDYPGKYVARLWSFGKPTEVVIVRDTLAEVRALIPASFIRLAPSVGDDPVIVETWV